jgi:hypothetical protein
LKKRKQQESSSENKIDLTKSKKYSPYSFRVFIALHSLVSFGFFMWAILSFMFILLAVVQVVSAYEILIWISIYVLGIYLLIVVVSYLRFLGWKERLSFPVYGWDELLAERSTITGDKYREAFLQIVPVEGTSGANLTYLNAALKIHNQKQNREIGKKDFWESRTQWHLLSKLEATGSVNSYGIGRMMNCLREECTEIAKRTQCIKEVRIRFDKKDFEYNQRPIV